MTQVSILPEVTAYLGQNHGHYIDGQTVQINDEARIELENPATNEIVATIAHATQTTVNQAVESSHQAFKGVWANTSPYQRGVLLNKLADKLEQHGEELAQLESLTSGKLIMLARHLEVAQSVIFLRYFAGWATKINGQTMQPSFPSMQGEQYTAMTYRQPIGVVAGIVPWNFSLMIGIWKIASALCTGCTVVLKPSEFTSLSLLRLAELATEVGIPAGVINVVNGRGDVGQCLVEHPLVKKVSFTGSVPTGMKVGELAMRHDLTRVSLELGGKNGAAILEDANIDQILPVLIQSTFVHQGQVCAAPERFYVHQSKYEEFVSKMSAALGQLTIGNPLEEGSLMGPLANQPQFEKVSAYLKLARDNGQVLCGGNVVEGPGYFVEPTLVKANSPDDVLALEENFGPLVCVIPFESHEELVEQMNATRFGLTASLWGNDLSAIFRLIPQLEVGTLWVNMHSFLDPSVPFGGIKASGLGREFSDAFIEAYTEIKSVMMCY